MKWLMRHELRTPLNHIIGFTELVVDKTVGDLNETQEDFLRDVLTISRHLLSNAVKFTPNGGQIRLTADLTDIALLVADSRKQKVADQKIHASHDEQYNSHKAVRIL